MDWLLSPEWSERHQALLVRRPQVSTFNRCSVLPLGCICAFAHGTIMGSITDKRTTAGSLHTLQAHVRGIWECRAIAVLLLMVCSRRR